MVTAAIGDLLASLERRVVAMGLRQLPISTTRRLRTRLQHRYAGSGGPVLRGRMRRGHQLLLDLRSPVQATAFFSGRYDEELVDVALTLLDRPGAVALDLGANIGLWTVPLAARAAAVGGHVVAVEPLVANRHRLRDNLELNGLAEHCEIVPAAVSDHTGHIQLALRGDFTRGATTGNAAVTIRDGADAELPQEQADVVRVDDLGLDDHDAPVRVVKVDVEGHEDRVLFGARHLLKSSRPTIIAEWNRVYYERRQVDPTAAVDEILRDVDYDVLRRRKSGWRSQPDFSSPKELDNLLLTPRQHTASLTRLANGTAPGA